MDRKKELKELFFSEPDLSLRKAAEMLDIPYVTARKWATEGGWFSQRLHAFLKELPQDIATQANDIRLVIYRMLISDELTPNDVKNLVDAWINTTKFSKQSEGITIARDDLVRELLNESNDR